MEQKQGKKFWLEQARTSSNQRFARRRDLGSPLHLTCSNPSGMFDLIFRNVSP